MNVIQRYGLTAGLVWANTPFIIYYTNLAQSDKQAYIMYVAAALYILFIVLGILQRRTDLGGILPQREGLRVGLGISLLAALILGVALFFYFKNVDLNYVDAIRNADAAEQIKQGKTPSEIREMKDGAIRNYPLGVALQTTMLVILGGGLVSVIASFIFARGVSRQIK